MTINGYTDDIQIIQGLFGLNRIHLIYLLGVSRGYLSVEPILPLHKVSYSTPYTYPRLWSIFEWYTGCHPTLVLPDICFKVTHTPLSLIDCIIHFKQVCIFPRWDHNQQPLFLSQRGYCRSPTVHQVCNPIRSIRHPRSRLIRRLRSVTTARRMTRSEYGDRHLFLMENDSGSNADVEWCENKKSVPA